jgi:hypothetical protein
MTSKSSPISQLQSSIKSQIFQPIYMNFPFLDTLGLPNRERARASASTFTDFIVDAVRKEPANSKSRGADQSSRRSRSELSQRLVDACSDGVITERQLRNNLTITFVAGQENPELALVSTLYLLAKNPVCDILCMIAKWSSKKTILTCIPLTRDIRTFCSPNSPHSHLNAHRPPMISPSSLSLPRLF